MSQKLTNTEKFSIIREDFLKQTDIVCEYLDRRPVADYPITNPKFQKQWKTWWILNDQFKKAIKEQTK